MSDPIVLPPRPSRRLDGRVAIVTGAGSLDDGLGNGRAISLLLASDGATVVCADQDLPSAERTVEMIVQEEGKAVSLCADVSSEADCEKLVRAAQDMFGRLDIVVNNVGIMGAKGTAVDASAEEWTKGLSINVTAMMLMAKYAIPLMLKNQPGDGRFAGFLYTPMVAGSGMSDEVRSLRRRQGLLNTEGNAWDCAAAVRFLASDEARWITGTTMTVDAGAACSCIMPE
ncbi:Glucose 1-dehydrogenase 2 [Trichoderma ghanense]|uniref:Glucose 1-dehydrogenase 2 n=1 Tax=Trichoderma ghanense TaxID=65468 RepID=A0ABY2HFK3_9HYPO